jgi:hemoglobin
MQNQVCKVCAFVIVAIALTGIGCSKHAKKQEQAPKSEPKVTAKTEAPAKAPADAPKSAAPAAPAAPATAPAAKQPTAVPANATLYERLGGEPAIRAVVKDFVVRSSTNPKVNFSREGIPGAKTWDPTPENVKKVEDRLVQFIANVTGGPIKYEGADMQTAHKGMKITNAQFDAIAADLAASLKKFNVPEKETKELMTLAAGTRQAIVEEGDPKAATPTTKPAAPATKPAAPAAKPATQPAPK